MIIKCTECGKDISDKSEKCIHCGFPLKSKIEKTKAKWIPGRIFLGVMTILLALGFNNYVSIKILEEGTSAIETGGFSVVLMFINGILMLCMCKNTNYKTLAIPTLLFAVSHFIFPSSTIYTIIGMILGLAWLSISLKQKKSK